MKSDWERLIGSKIKKLRNRKARNARYYQRTKGKRALSYKLDSIKLPTGSDSLEKMVWHVSFMVGESFDWDLPSFNGWVRYADLDKWADAWEKLFCKSEFYKLIGTVPVILYPVRPFADKLPMDVIAGVLRITLTAYIKHLDKLFREGMKAPQSGKAREAFWKDTKNQLETLTKGGNQ
jgi:hypothetical protein